MKPRHARALVHRIERATAEALGQGDPSPPQPTKLLVAVSGGADSSATLLALSERAQQHGWQLSAVHVDHGIAAPAIRAAFRTAVRDLTERLEVPLVECAVDVPGVAAGEGLSIETAARRERYAALSRVASQEAVAAVVTGHTIDDQAESVLLHLLRGSGLDGLSGMAAAGVVPTAPLSADTALPPLVRPLLGVRRAETRELCAHHCVTFVDDPANEDPAFTRNRIRGEVLPVLEAVNPNIVRTLAQLSTDVRPDRLLLDDLTRQAFADVSQSDDRHEIFLSRAALADLPEALRIRVLRFAVTRLADTPSHDRAHALARLATKGGHRIDCGGGVQAEARGDRLRIWRRGPAGLRVADRTSQRAEIDTPENRVLRSPSRAGNPASCE